MSYKAIIFDLDGTLLDTLEDLADAVNRVLFARGFPGHGLDSYRSFIGDSAVDMKTATAASMFAAGAGWGFRSADELLANGCRVLIKQPHELLDLLPRRVLCPRYK